MLRGPLHNRGADGLCEACREPFPCASGIAIYEAVKRDLESTGRVSTPTGADTAETPVGPPLPNWTPPEVHWEDLADREYRCPKCLHWWVSHGVPTEDYYYGCMTIESSAAERWEMSQRDRELQRQGVPPKVAGPQAYRELRYCGCTFAEGNTVIPRQVRMAEG